MENKHELTLGLKDIEKQLKEILETEKKNQYSLKAVYQFITQNQKDSRAGVQKLCQKAEKYISGIQSERQRLIRMSEYEKHYLPLVIAGVDEVGRGPLAGPVVAGIVILDPKTEILYLNDSKKLNDGQRRELAEEIKEKALDYATASISPERIDQINILQATYEAMTYAFESLKYRPDILFNDAVRIPQIKTEQLPIIKGDSRSISIAAASILAKVVRDDLMIAYDSLYPEYQFAHNKGYGSAAHISAIKSYGLCEIHRKSFVQSILKEKE